MNDIIFDGLDELYHRAKFGEDRNILCAPAVGAKMWCLFFFLTGRMHQKFPLFVTDFENF